MNKPHLSIVLPCYNPPPDWVEVIEASYSSIANRLGFLPQLVVVNDGSPSFNTNKIAELKTRVPDVVFVHYEKNKGKGYALRQGVGTAQGTLTIYIDVDFPYTDDSFMAIYHALANENADAAIGVKDEDYYNHTPPFRRLISKSLRNMIGAFYRMPITDTQCGLKGFNEKGKAVFLSTNIDRYLFDLEFVRNLFSVRPKLLVKAVPIAVKPGVVFRKMNTKILMGELKDFVRVTLSKPKKGIVRH